MSAQPDPAAPDTASVPTTVGPLAGVAIGVVAAVLALVPWLVTDMRLPLQNLWAEQTLPEAMPVALLPLSQYALTDVMALLVMGPAVAGLVLRALRRAPQVRVRRGMVLGASGGVLAVHAVVAVQSLRVVSDGLSSRRASDLYFGALVVLVVTGVVTGLVVLALLTALSRAAFVLGVAVVALLAGSWVSALASPVAALPEGALAELAA